MRDADAMQQLYRVAERHGQLLRDSLLARELVTDVIEDMFVGEVTCDLARTLAPQIERHVRRRANRRRKANRPGRKRRGALRSEFIPLEEAPRSALVADLPQDAPDAAEEAPESESSPAMMKRRNSSLRSMTVVSSCGAMSLPPG